MGFVEDLQEAAARVLTQAGPAVVRIGRGWGRGSGFVVRDGIVVTNAHNLRGPETTVTFADGRVATGTAAGVDTDGDLAVLTVDTTGVSLPPVFASTSSEIEFGTGLGFSIRLSSGSRIRK